MRLSSCFKALITSISFLMLVSGEFYAQPLNSVEIDNVVERAMKAFSIPGMAVAVVKDGTIRHIKGYGVRSVDTGEKMDENTRFAIASNTKAFTATALAILVSEGKIKWGSRVSDIIPEFRMYSPYVTEEFNIADLLSHRSGLGLGAGDLMLWPDGANFTKSEIIHNLRYLKPVSQFRTKYDYDNLLYIVAGEVIARVSGISWEDFVQKRILNVLGMERSAPSYTLLSDRENIIDGHMLLDNRIVVVPMSFTPAGNAAGGIYSSVTDMCKWVQMHLNGGVTQDGISLLHRSVHNDLFTPQTIIPVREPGHYSTNFSSYGLGWRLCDIKGHKEASHTGGLSGILTQVTLIPSLNLGIIVLTNQQSSAAFNSVTNSIKDGYLNTVKIDWTGYYLQKQEESQTEDETITKEIWDAVSQNEGRITDKEYLLRYAGTYNDNWFGRISVTMGDKRLIFTSERSPGLKGEIFHCRGNLFVVKWYDRTLQADAFMLFSEDMQGKTAGITMKAISPLTDFSYDFHDLNFVRIER